MKAEFSFTYGENTYCLAAQDGAVYEPEKDIRVSVVKKDYPAFDAEEWVLYFENNSDCNSGIFSDIWDCDTLLPFEDQSKPRNGYRPVEGDSCVITMNGTVDGRYYWENDKVSATEYNFQYEYLDKAREQTKQFANVGGRSSDGTMPFFDVTSKGEGYIAAVGWTGDWKAEFAKKEEGIRMKSGLTETAFYLEPGEKIRTSSVLIMHYSAEEDKHNKFRRLIKNHCSHKSHTGASREGLMAFELWGGLTSEEMKKRLNELKDHGIRFEDVWIDAGWYGNCTKCDEAFSGDWAAHTGNWNVNPRVHPGGLADVAACAKEAGMHLMLWFEPERAVEGTPMTVEHPDWFLRFQDRTNLILNYGKKEARDYICDLILAYVEKLELSCYRQDFNVCLTEYFKENDPQNRRGISEIKHITGMYEVWDRILEKAPHLLIDNCSSGGRRIDIETLKRSVPFFRSDYQCNFNENPEVLQTHNANISRYLPYNGCTSKTKNDRYAIRSSYSSSWGGAFYNAIFQSMTEEEFAWAKEVTEEYRAIRKYMTMDFYNHGAEVFDETSWAIWQYHHPERKRCMVMAFRRTASPFAKVEIALNGLDPDRTYTYRNLDSGEVIEGGSQLEIVLSQKRSSTIIIYGQSK